VSLIFDRRYELIVGDMLFTDLEIGFTAVRSLKDTSPNSLEMTITNVMENRRLSMSLSKLPTVQLSAGYKENMGVIFLGQAREITHSKQQTEWITSISSADGEDSMSKSRVNKSFAPGVSYETVVLEVAKSMGGIGLGNLQKLLKKGALPTKRKKFVKGVTVSGPSKKELRRLMLASGLEWSIQNSKFQVLEANKTLQTVAYVLSKDTGLLGSPVSDNKGNLEVTCHLNPQIVPGRQIEVRSKYVKGFYRCVRVEYRGSYPGGEWRNSIEATRI
jgi:hypothetical protein